MTARAVQLVLYWGETGLAAADGLSNLLKVGTPFCAFSNLSLSVSLSLSV